MITLQLPEPFFGFCVQASSVSGSLLPLGRGAGPAPGGGCMGAGGFRVAVAETGQFGGHGYVRLEICEDSQ